MYDDLRKSRQLIIACRDIADQLVLSLPPGTTRESLHQIARVLNQALAVQAKTDLIAYPVLTRAHLSGDTLSTRGMKLYEACQTVCSLEGSFGAFNAMVFEKFRDDWNRQSPRLLATSAVMSAQADTIDRLLNNLAAGGYEFERIQENPVDIAEFDIPLSQMNDKEIMEKFRAARLEVQEAIRVFQESRQSCSTLQLLISKIRRMLHESWQIAFASLTEDIPYTDKLSQEEVLRTAEQLIVSVAEILQASLNELAAIIQPIFADWGLPHFEPEIVSPLCGQAARAAPHHGQPFSEGAIERAKAVEAVHISVFETHGQLRAKMRIASTFSPIVIMLLDSMEAAHGAIFACRYQTAWLKRQQATLVTTAAPIVPLTLSAVRLELSVKAADAVFFAQTSICNWLLFLAARKRLQAGSQDAEKRAEWQSRILGLTIDAHTKIVQVGQTFSWADMDEQQQSAARSMGMAMSGNNEMIESIRERGIRLQMAHNTLTNSGIGLMQSYNKPFMAIDDGKLETLPGMEVTRLQAAIPAVTAVLDVAYPTLAEVNKNLAQLLKELNFLELAAAVEAMF